MNTMTDKCYTARIEFDERDAIFVGRVQEVKAIIGFHGETVAGLRADFEAAIDFMIDDCKARGESLVFIHKCLGDAVIPAGIAGIQGTGM